MGYHTQTTWNIGISNTQNVISNTLYAVLYRRVINKMYRFFSTYIYLSIDRLFYCVCTCAVYTKLCLSHQQGKVCIRPLILKGYSSCSSIFSTYIGIFVSFLFPTCWYTLSIKMCLDEWILIRTSQFYACNKLHFLYTPTICTNWCSDAPWCL